MDLQDCRINVVKHLFSFFFSKYVLLFYTFISVFSREITGNEATKVLRALDWFSRTFNDLY